jgi:PleD family two-component response regulator
VATSVILGVLPGARLSTPEASPAAALALVAGGDAWLAVTLESVLQAAGYRVLRVATGAEALGRARTGRPDCVLVATPLPDITGVELCRAITRDPEASPCVPVIAIASDPVTGEERLAWLRAGAWDLLGLSLGAEELVLKLETLVRAKREADRAWEEALVDRTTGLYNPQGMRRRARELVAEALRQGAMIACVVFGPDPRPEERRGPGGLREHVGSVLRRHARASDVVGWWDGAAGGADFAVLAPATNADGAALLAQRLVRAIETAGSVPTLEVRAGYDALSDAGVGPSVPDDLLARASAALQLARVHRREAHIRRSREPLSG